METKKSAHRQTGRIDKGRQGKIHEDKQAKRQTGRQGHREAVRETDRYILRHTYRDIQANRPIGKQAGMSSDTQTKGRQTWVAIG